MLTGEKQMSPKRIVPRIPKFEVEHVIQTLSQVTDWGLQQHKVPATWQVTQGEGEAIYVIDTGWSGHPDLDIIKGHNAVRGETIDDGNGHQTHCMGIIAAKNDDAGMVGVAPKAKIVAVKGLANNGSGSYYSILNALKFCLNAAKGEHPDLPTPTIISMSLGAPGDMGSEIHGIIKELYNLNIPILCAAGNSGRRGVDYPGAYPETIAIAAYDKNGNIANFSAIGEQVDFAAPGVQIYSTWLNNGYAKLNGTSMATPFMAGVTALLLAKHRKQVDGFGRPQNDCQTVEQIREHFKKYAIDKGPAGHDNHWGYGIVDTNKLIIAESNNEQPVEEPDTGPKPPKMGDPIKWPSNWLQRFINWLVGKFK
jgi:major intracellular serine protease